MQQRETEGERKDGRGTMGGRGGGKERKVRKRNGSIVVNHHPLQKKRQGGYVEKQRKRWRISDNV